MWTRIFHPKKLFLMLIKLLDKALHKDHFIGRHYIKAPAENRKKLLRLRARFHRKDILARRAEAARIADAAFMEIPDDLGFKVLQDYDFPEVPRMLEEALEIVATHDLEKIRKNKKPQLMTGLLKPHWLKLESPFVQFPLRKEVAASISNYLGCVPVITKIDLWYSRYSKEMSTSQFFHCDYESGRQIKTFIFAKDVEMADGPFTAIGAKRSDDVRKALKYRYGDKIPDEAVNPIVPPEEHVVVTGHKGTMLFGDTSRCFHYGSRVEDPERWRLAVLYQFLRPQSFLLSLNYRKSAPFAFLATPDMPLYQRMMLGASF